MVDKKIIWTPEAIISYHTLVQYLALEWGDTSKRKFLRDAELLIKLITRNPQMFKRSIRYKNIRIGYLSKQCSMIYRVKPREIEILMFWDNRHDSKELRF